MVLNELGNRISAALRHLTNSEKVDEEALAEMLKEIGNALIASDVAVPLVIQLRQRIRDRVNLAGVAAGLSKAKLVRQAVVEELRNLLDPKTKPWTPKKGRPNVLMMIGLQGGGKTTTVTKLAYYYKRKGFKPGLVCADTFRAGAFAQLRQNAARAKVPFYGSESETDPVKVASDGVGQFRAEGADLIIVDTSGRHKQAGELFVEMEQVAAAIKPDLIIFVMDGSIGQAAQDQAAAFKARVPIGAVVITKLDGHAKGGGALSAVAATQSPIIFLGTGERIPDLQEFDAERFVQRLLGMGDMKELLTSVQEVMPEDQQKRLEERMRSGKMTLRDLQDQFTMAMKLGPLDKVIQCLPGFSNMKLPPNVDAGAGVKHFLNILDSMTAKELDSRDVLPMSQSRIQRIARGSGRSVAEVQLLLEQFKMLEKIGKVGGRVGRGGIPDMKQLAQMGNVLPPQVLAQMGGVSGLKGLMKSLKDGGGFPGFS